MELNELIDSDLLNRYEFVNYGHALEILTTAFTSEWVDILACLKNFKITKADLLASGGNESPIPKKIDELLYPKGWKEIRIKGNLTVEQYIRQASQRKRFDERCESVVIENYIDGHNIDFIKNKVALDLEWNSKDQTFDRDLMAMRTYHECGIIDVGIILTRAENLNDIFSELGIKSKYGASTTWMGKLTYRLDARRNGGCPILAIGITKRVIENE